jgi:integrase
MKIDPYKNKERYEKWKRLIEGKTIPELSKVNSDLIKNYLFDMENGLNVAKGSRKGARSHIRLNNLRIRIIFIAKKIDKLYSEDMTSINERQIVGLFNKMRNGEILRADGKTYQAVADYVKCFKAFWHWHQKVSRKQGKIVEDITLDVDSSREKPKWVYLTEEQVLELSNNARYELRVLIMFLYDTGIRAPTEIMNLKVSDFFNNFKEVNIRDEISKTFGRRIKLMLSGNMIREYIKICGLGEEDLIFKICPSSINRSLKNLAKKLFGDELSPAGQRYSDLTMYDFRHCSCCYWMPRYKSESALKYRFGWKKSDKIHYYSELLGMRDTISEEDMLLDVTKTEIEQRLSQSEKKNSILNEEMVALRSDMKKMLMKLSLLDDQTDKKLIVLESI